MMASRFKIISSRHSFIKGLEAIKVSAGVRVFVNFLPHQSHLSAGGCGLLQRGCLLLILGYLKNRCTKTLNTLITKLFCG
jgi:hypothetical protein